MKKVFNLFYGSAFATVALLSGCGEDETDPKPAPTITAYIGTPGTITTASPSGTITYTATAGEGIQKIDVVSASGGSTTPITPFPKTKDFKSSTTDEGTVTFNITPPAAGATAKITLTVTDKKGATDSEEITITSTAGTINTYTTVILGSYTNQTVPSFLATTTGTRYNQADAKTNSSLVDILYYFGASNQATLAAPDDSQARTEIYNNATTGLNTWTTRNATRFAKSTSAVFDASTTSAAIGTAVGTPTLPSVPQLVVGDVVAFKTAAGKSGLAKVTAITTGAPGTITLDVKVQK